MIKHVITAAVCSAFVTLTAFSQSVTDLVGKPMTDASVAKFSTDNGLDPISGLGYSKGVQLFQDNGLVHSIYLFNAGAVNGNDMMAYQGALPFQLTFKDSPETLKKKIAGTPTSKGEHLVWDMKTYQLEVVFADEKKTSISYVSVEKK